MLPQAAALTIAPESLLVLAEESREAGGVVFVGEITGEPGPLPPYVFHSHGDTYVAYPLARVSIDVVDVLGETIADPVEHVVHSGPEYVSDAEGNPTCEFVEQDILVGIQALPLDGLRAFFLYCAPGTCNGLRWSAPTANGVVSGVNTQSMQDATLAELTRPAQ